VGGKKWSELGASPECLMSSWVHAIDQLIIMILARAGRGGWRKVVQIRGFTKVLPVHVQCPLGFMI